MFPVDVEAKVTVSSVSGEKGEIEKDAAGGAAEADGAKASSNREVSAKKASTTHVSVRLSYRKLSSVTRRPS